jgi:FAD/FMN-containing dehydrogenase
VVRLPFDEKVAARFEEWKSENDLTVRITMPPRSPRSAPFAAALRAAKAAVDPVGVLNPGVLIDPLPATRG